MTLNSTPARRAGSTSKSCSPSSVRGRRPAPRKRSTTPSRGCAPWPAMWQRSPTSIRHSNYWRGNFFNALTIRTLGRLRILVRPLRSKVPRGSTRVPHALVSITERFTATVSGIPGKTWRTCVARGLSREQGRSMAKLALEGLRILDLTQVAVGPYATLLLGFMGAEVIKVESCSRLDISRGPARPTSQGEGLYPGGEPGERPWNRAAHYVHRNGNKRSLTLDLAIPHGKALLLQLATMCDVLIENFRASVMDRLGLGYEALAQANPRLIYVKISSQGATGPERDYGSLGSTLEQTAGLA